MGTTPGAHAVGGLGTVVRVNMTNYHSWDASISAKDRGELRDEMRKVSQQEFDEVMEVSTDFG